jgi:hypothetical protein
MDIAHYRDVHVRTRTSDVAWLKKVVAEHGSWLALVPLLAPVHLLSLVPCLAPVHLLALVFLLALFPLLALTIVCKHVCIALCSVDSDAFEGPCVVSLLCHCANAGELVCSMELFECLGVNCGVWCAGNKATTLDTLEPSLLQDPQALREALSTLANPPWANETA